MSALPSSIPIVNETKYGAEHVTVTLEWVAEPLVTYNVTVVPDSLRQSWITGNSSFNMTLSYNILYNVRIMATQCKKKSTNVYTLHYGKSIGHNIVVLANCKIFIYYRVCKIHHSIVN